MPLNFRYPQLVLRGSLALVFFWFGLDKFIDPRYWAGLLPHFIVGVVAAIHVDVRDLMFLTGIFELLVAISLLTGFFMRWFAAAAIVFVIISSLALGFGQAFAAEISILGGLIAIAIWPERSYI